MAISAQAQVRFWLVASVTVLVMLYILSDVLLPFILGMVIAYFLNPVCHAMSARGMPRWMATTVLLIGFLSLVTLALLLLVPMLISQFVSLFRTIPEIQAYVEAEVIPMIEQLSQRLTPTQMAEVQAVIRDLAQDVFSFVRSIPATFSNVTFAVLNILTVAFVTPVVAWYMLLDWDEFLETVDRKLPREHAYTVRMLAREADNTMASFIRGQATVCMILATYYGVLLSIAGLQFGLVVGLTAGLISFIPFIGAIVGFFLSVGLALFQFDLATEHWRIVGVAMIFVFGQLFENNFLTPKLVGSSVRLHPVWIMFALLAGGTLYGLVGMLVSVPVAAIIGVLVRFGVRQYLSSHIYTGTRGVSLIKPEDPELASTRLAQEARRLEARARAEAEGARILATQDRVVPRDGREGDTDPTRPILEPAS